MSRAFVKESAEAAPPPERMVAKGPNLVTREGLAQIEGHVARLEAALTALSHSAADTLQRETLARDLRCRPKASTLKSTSPKTSPPPR
jgi:hypothetical protein